MVLMVTQWRNHKMCYASHAGCGYHRPIFIHYKIAKNIWADAAILQALRCHAVSPQRRHSSCMHVAW